MQVKTSRLPALLRPLCGPLTIAALLVAFTPAAQAQPEAPEPPARPPRKAPPQDKQEQDQQDKAPRNKAQHNKPTPQNDKAKRDGDKAKRDVEPEDVDPDAGPDNAKPDDHGDKPAEPKPVEGRDLLADAIKPEPGGLRPEQVAKRGAEASPDAAAKRAELRAASAKVDQAMAAYFPKATASFTYTRLSPVTNDLGGGLVIPVQLNSYMFAAGVEVPVSDYVLRLTQAYATVSLGEDAKRSEQRAAELQAALDAEVAYYNWIRAYGQAKVAELSVAQAEQHLKDAVLSESAGMISKADVLRLQAQRAQALHLTRAAKGLSMVTDQQLRLRMRSKPSERLTIGVDVMDLPPDATRYDLPTLQALALENRLEIKALKTTIQSLEEVESVQRAGMYPRVDAFANLLVANPNPRIFLQNNEFNTTWDVGVRLSWTINDTFTQLGAVAEANAQVQTTNARLEELKNGIKLAVAGAYNDLQTAHSSVVAAEESEKAAALALSLRRRLLLGGKATGTEIVDADAALTQARLQRINAHVDAHIAYAKLRHAVGGSLKRAKAALARRRALARKQGARDRAAASKPQRQRARSAEPQAKPRRNIAAASRQAGPTR